MSYVANILASYGFTLSQAKSFILANIENPKHIYETMGRYSITFAMISEIYGPETNTESVKDYFYRSGLDISTDRPISNSIALINVQGSNGEIINQYDVEQWLANFDLNFSQMQDFVYSNIATPDVLYDTLAKYQISFAMVAVLYGNGITEYRVKSYFESNGLDVSDDVPYASAIYLPNVSEVLTSKSSTNIGIDNEASMDTVFVDSIVGENIWHYGLISFSFPSVIPLEYLRDHKLSKGWRELFSDEKLYFQMVANTQNSYIEANLTLSSNLGDIKVSAIYQDSAEAFAYFPGTGIGGDIFLNSDSDDEYYSSYGIHVMAHELGHAMGLSHTFEGNPLDFSYDNSYYSSMSYAVLGGREVEALDQGTRYSTYTVDAYRTELGIIDVAALQAMYGADMSTNTGDTLYVYNEAQRGFESAAGHYHTIWDAGGNDTLDLSAAKYNSTINLNDYTLSSVSERTSFEEAVEVAHDAGLTSQASITFIQDFIDELGEQAFLNHNNLGIAYGVVIENVITGSGDDSVIDNVVDNQIYTGAGNDMIYLGAGGYDYVDGGQGIDSVVLNVNYADVERFVDNEGYHLLADDFAATLVGIETVQYLDISESIV